MLLPWFWGDEFQKNDFLSIHTQLQIAWYSTRSETFQGPKHWNSIIGLGNTPYVYIYIYKYIGVDLEHTPHRGMNFWWTPKKTHNSGSGRPMDVFVVSHDIHTSAQCPIQLASQSFMFPAGHSVLFQLWLMVLNWSASSRNLWTTVFHMCVFTTLNDQVLWYVYVYT